MHTEIELILRIKEKMQPLYKKRSKIALLYSSWARSDIPKSDVEVVLKGSISGREFERIDSTKIKVDTLMSVYPVSEMYSPVSLLLLSVQKEVIIKGRTLRGNYYVSEKVH